MPLSASLCASAIQCPDDISNKAMRQVSKSLVKQLRTEKTTVIPVPKNSKYRLRT